MDYHENAYGVLKKGMVQCNSHKEEINDEMKMLTVYLSTLMQLWLD